jgi:hypothetical protein
MLLKRTNPNRNHPQRPDPIPGAPKAFRPGEEGVLDALPGEANEDELTYQARPPEVEPGGWVTVQLALWPVPRACCSCLRETDRIKQIPAAGQMKLPVRLCRPCGRIYGTKSAIWMFIGFLIGGAAAYFWATTWRRIDEVTPWIVGGIAGLLALAIAAVIANSFARPVRFSRFNGQLNTIRVRFINPDYTAVFMNESPPAGLTVRSPILDIPPPPAGSWQA